MTDWQPAYTRAHEAWKRKREREAEENRRTMPDAAAMIEEELGMFKPYRLLAIRSNGVEKGDWGDNWTRKRR